MQEHDSNRIDRRSALKWVSAAIVAFPLLEWDGQGRPQPNLQRTLSDPDLLNPGKLWERTMTPDELRTINALCDVILPADEKSAAASQIGTTELHETGVGDFMDEWVSAPYPVQQADQKMIRAGLTWLNAESKKRFAKDFASLAPGEQTKICDDICYLPKARPEFKTAAEFFARVRDLSMSAFYTTKKGMDDLGYIGNVPLATFNGPPRRVLEYLKLV